MASTEVARLTQSDEEVTRGPSYAEIEVMRLVAEGLKDRAIANSLGVSLVTVRRRAQSFCRAVGARNRAHAIALSVGTSWFEGVEGESTGAQDETPHTAPTGEHK